MQSGRAPYGVDGKPMEVHHIRPIGLGGTNDPDNLKIMTQTEHRLGSNYTLNHKTNVPDPC
ncbi:HNH/ENDO VII family nuclease [Herbiconiux ginsengi]|uniref:HNH/ENDO VII family nuclease n=1 Tax=Herbiconiux ginsengi TaxID=381665 RepID=UPI000B811ECA